MSRKLLAGWVIRVLWLSAMAWGGTAVSADGAEPPEPQGSEARPGPRLSFPLPDIVVEGEQLGSLGGSPRLQDSTGLGQRPLLERPGPTRYRPQAEGFEIRLPGRTSGGRARGLVRARIGEAASRDLSAAWSPSARGYLWTELVDWRHRVDGRRHLGLDVGFLAAEQAGEPGWLGGASGEVRDAQWDPDPDPAQRQPADSARRWRWCGSLERRVAARGVSAVAAARARLGGAEIEGSPGGWQALDLSLRSRPPAHDLRLLETGREAPPVSGVRADFSIDGGLVRRDDGVDEQVRGRLRGRCGVSLPIASSRLTMGIAAGGEGPQSVVGPWLAYRRLCERRRLLVALELAPQITYFDEWWGESEPLLDPALLREELPAARLPLVAEILDPLQPAQRAWPRLAGEVYWEGRGARLRGTVLLAQLRSPFDWEWRSLAGARLLASAHGESRFLSRVTLAAERSFGADLTARVHYRWVEDEESGTNRRLLLIPAQRLRAGLSWEPAAWRHGLSLEWCGGRYADHAGGRLPAFLALGARVGRAFGAHTLSLVGENLLGDEIASWPGEIIRDRWLALEWSCRFGAGVP